MGGRTKMSPTVSVVMPIYNSEGVLAATIDSLIAQSLKDIEIICVDDGSTDATPTIIQKYVEMDLRVKCVRQSNFGAGPARNAGLEVAHGEWVAFLDSDDIYLADFLNNLVDAAEKADADIAVCESDAFDSKTGKQFPWFRITNAVEGDAPSPYLLGEWLFQAGGSMPYNKIFRMSYIRNSGLRFQSLSNANDLYFVESATAGARAIALVRETQVLHRIASGASIQDGLTSNPTPDKCLCAYKALAALRCWCDDQLMLSDANRRSLDRLSITSSYGNCAKAVWLDDQAAEYVHEQFKDAFRTEWAIHAPKFLSDPTLYIKYRIIADLDAREFCGVFRGLGRTRMRSTFGKGVILVRSLLALARSS